MIRALLVGLVLATAACSDKSFGSLCTNLASAPAACAMACSPTPGALNTCPTGFHCSADGKCDAQCTATGGQCGDGFTCASDGTCVTGTGGCVGLACQVADCQSMGMPATTIAGTVFAPNGTLPLYGVTVYIPNSDPGSFKPGVQCGSCSDGLPGDPIANATTDDKGQFSLQGVPSGTNIPVVITIGKWRRQITVANVAACSTVTLDAADTRLPKSHDDMTPNTRSVDMPQIAISTGRADSLECLVRRLGIADKEITTDAQGGKIHLFTDTGAGTSGGTGAGVSSFDTGFGGGTGGFSNSQTLWGNATDPGKLSSYDIVILSCEGAQHAETKPQQAMDHLKAYADLGGRVFMSHWHNVWLEGSTQNQNVNAKPAIWTGIATFDDAGKDPGNGISDTIDQLNNLKGMSFANWMANVQTRSPTKGQVVLLDGTAKHTSVSLDNAKAERWVYLQSGQSQFPQNFQFTTPNEVAPENRCGKVVFSDMHVSGGPMGGNYPTSCGPATTLSDQEKALAFMFFDISSCVGVLF